MELKELLEHFNNGDTLGEDFEVIELMRYYSRQAQKITMEINTKYHEPEELQEPASIGQCREIDQGDFGHIESGGGKDAEKMAAFVAAVRRENP